YSNHVDLHDDKPVHRDTTVSPLPLAKAGQQKDLKKVFAHLNIPSSTKDMDANLVAPVIQSDRIVMSERKNVAGITPNVYGMGLKDAVYLLENAGYRVKVNGRGNVVRQSINSGTRIIKGQLIILDLDI
ncbi:MAG: PASTA domain-containing protein, partial [Bacteroidia bacterium]|nr:PASTA domain-containing protein [Bacteroidia bacterium]MBP6657387.1 PASTA domain-containing protein [Bacteroidia bacterium]